MTTNTGKVQALIEHVKYISDLDTTSSEVWGDAWAELESLCNDLSDAEIDRCDWELAQVAPSQIVIDQFEYELGHRGACIETFKARVQELEAERDKLSACLGRRHEDLRAVCLERRDAFRERNRLVKALEEIKAKPATYNENKEALLMREWIHRIASAALDAVRGEEEKC